MFGAVQGLLGIREPFFFYFFYSFFFCCVGGLSPSLSLSGPAVLMQEPVVPFSFLRAKPIGVMQMIDQGEQDDKVIAVHAGAWLTRRGLRRGLSGSWGN